jgi:bacillopeptidase F (M6 metalloprotease family)
LESNVSTFSVIVTEYYQPSTGGRPYQSDRVVATMLTEVDAKLLAAEYNTKASGSQYYSIQEVE